ncbi:MAG: hypothetical protein OEZ16_01765 [Chromatiales bacterium]|nr:hypothetical protein [Chromatiales bacterium]
MTTKSSYGIAFLLLMFGIAWGCGPEYDEDSYLELSLKYDPAVSTTINSRHVLNALGIAELRWQDEPSIDVLAEINAITSTAGRTIEFVQTGSEYSGNSILDRCPLRGNHEIRKMLDEVKYSKLIIMSRERGNLHARYNQWDTIPEGKGGREKMYTEWLDKVVRNVVWMCDVKAEYYTQLQRRQNVQDYVAPRDDELFTQLRDHPQLHHYAALVEALVLYHEGDYDGARTLAQRVANDSQEKSEIELAIAIDKLAPAKGDSRQRYVVDKPDYDRYSWGYCASNTPENALSLIRSAAKVSSLNDNAYRLLVAWRIAMLIDCANAKTPPEATGAPDVIDPHLLYMHALTHFYSGNYEQAASHYMQVAQRGKGWLSQTSRYLIARSYLLAAQKEWDSFSKLRPDQIQLLNGAYDAFNSYITHYPEGPYLNSARGLLRRVELLRGNKEIYLKLLDEALEASLVTLSYQSTLNSQDRHKVASLLNEYTIYVQDDELTSVDRLQATLSRIDLSANRELATIASELDYLKAAIEAYEQRNITFFENNHKRNSQLDDYHGVLTARALEHAGRYSEANEAWSKLKQILPYSTDVELAIATNIMRTGSLTDLLSSQYGIRDAILVGYLSAQCGTQEDQKLLDADLNSSMRTLVLHDLAMRYLTTGEIHQLQALFDKYDDSALGRLSSIRTAVRMVATGTDQGKGNMNIAYFLAHHGEPEHWSIIHQRYLENTDECVQTNGDEGSYTYFLKSLQHYENISSEVEAKTLHFLVLCDKVGSGGLSCWGEGERQPGKHWFERLHSKYPKSSWTAKTPYYYD